MKVIFTILLVVVVGDFLFARDAKGTKSGARPFYCLDAEAKATTVDSNGSFEIVNSCKDTTKSANDECIEKAKNTYCRNIKSSVPLYGKLSDVPNRSTCTEIANKILGTRGLGSLSKPDPSVNTVVPLTKSVSGQPIFQFNVSGNNSVYARSNLDKKSNEETWILAVASNNRIPSFEQRKDLGTNLGNSEPGDYRRFYNFRVVNNVCVLESIKTEFLPLAPKGEESYPKYQLQEKVINQKECDYSAQAFRGEKYRNQFGRMPAGDLLNNWVCNESVTSFNPPEKGAVTNELRQGRGHQGAERSR